MKFFEEIGAHYVRVDANVEQELRSLANDDQDMFW